MTYVAAVLLNLRLSPVDLQRSLLNLRLSPVDLQRSPLRLSSRRPLLLYHRPLSLTLSKPLLHSPHLLLRYLLPPSATTSPSTSYQQWDSLTATLAAAANLPFILLQLRQIILNAHNLLAGNNAALSAVPWLGMLTGLLGNLSLLSYLAKKRETEAVMGPILGVLSTYAVLVQLVLAGAMPVLQFAVTSVVVACGLVLNCLNYFGWLHGGVWGMWENFVTVGGLAVLAQVMWLTFVPFVPNSMLPGMISCTTAVAAIIMARTGKLSETGIRLLGSVSGWTATLLFMWTPVTQMWTSYLNPDNIRDLSASTMVLAMIGNGLMIPRALFIRDLMWFTGSAWASFLYGWGNLLCMYCFKSISKEYFIAVTVGFCLSLGIFLWRDSVAYGYNSPMRSLKELVFGA